MKQPIDNRGNHSSQHKTRILVVDDSSVERCLAGALLGSQPDFTILFADDGQSALERIRESRPEIVVTDLMMPRMNGLQLVRRSRKEFPQIPVILMTAYGSESLAVDALHDGAASYVPKAKRAERLVETVRRVLARSKANRNTKRLSQCIGKVDATFYLENDPESIPPVVDYVQQLVGGLEMSDEMERLRAGVALEEALVNAMCHGNLELTADDLDRSRGGGRSRLRDIVSARRSQHPYCDRRIVLEVHVTNNSARFVIRDSGQGFDKISTYRSMEKDCFDNGNGRGVALMNMLMDEVAYNEEGNELTLIKISKN